MPDPHPFHLPADIRYTCHGDGLCCRDTWEIRVEKEAAERVLRSEWRSCCDLPPRETTPFAPCASDASYLVFKRQGDACVFLGQDNRCRLHTLHGPEIKPYVCRRFPFRFVDTPGGTYVGFSFACPSVLHQNGAPAEDAREEARQVWALRDDHPRVEEPIRLDTTLTLTWEEYLQIERALDNILSREDHSVAHCLVAGHIWLSMLRRMLAPAIPQTLSYYLQQTEAENYARAFAIAQKPVAHPALKRMLLGSFLSFRNTLRPGSTRLLLLPRLTFENLRHWLRLGSLPLEPLPKRVPYRDFHPSPALLETPATQTLLRRYFRHALFRKELILGTDLFWGYCYLVMAHGLIEYYAAGLKALGEDNPALALSVVEQYFVLHSNFGRTFLYHPAMMFIFQRTFDRPNYAHTLALA